MPHLELTEVLLGHCNVLDSRVLYTFIPNNSFGQLFNISPKNFIFLKTVNSEFSYIQEKFTDQNSKQLQLEDQINTT